LYSCFQHSTKTWTSSSVSKSSHRADKQEFFQLLTYKADVDQADVDQADVDQADVDLGKKLEEGEGPAILGGSDCSSTRNAKVEISPSRTARSSQARSIGLRRLSAASPRPPRQSKANGDGPAAVRGARSARRG
jgi:hypothetical protein